MADIGFTLTAACRTWYFDRPLVAARIKAAGLTYLPKIGAYVRQRARTRILQRRKSVSPVGSPPSVHSTDPQRSLRRISFAFSPESQSVVIGPERFNQVNTSWLDLRGKTVPQIQEFGDVVTIREESRADGQPWGPGAYWRRRDLRTGTRTSKLYRTRQAAYGPRPFMGPALRQEIAAGTIPQTLAYTVKAA